MLSRFEKIISKANKPVSRAMELSYGCYFGMLLNVGIFEQLIPHFIILNNEDEAVKHNDKDFVITQPQLKL